ncbi:hypothetical protein M758_UG097600 [Ceratodon purpureus]|nr:hypothetical protein M758_UG097600 [Ceratodon purpureus]
MRERFFPDSEVGCHGERERSVTRGLDGECPPTISKHTPTSVTANGGGEIRGAPARGGESPANPGCGSGSAPGGGHRGSPTGGKPGRTLLGWFARRVPAPADTQGQRSGAAQPRSLGGAHGSVPRCKRGRSTRS